MNKYNYNPIKMSPFKWFVLENFPFIEEDFDSLTSYGLWCKLKDYFDKVANKTNEMGTQVESLTNAFSQLKNYIDNYFDNLNVQEEINNKLDEMAESGALDNIIKNALLLVPKNIYYLSRIYRNYNFLNLYKNVGICYNDNKIIYLNQNEDKSESKVFIYDTINKTLNYFDVNITGVTDIGFKNNIIYYSNNSYTIYRSDLVGNMLEPIVLSNSIKKFDIKENIIIVDSLNNVLILDSQFNLLKNTEINIEDVESITMLDSDIVILNKDKTLSVYQLDINNNYKFNNNFSLPYKANESIVTGTFTSITVMNNNLLFATYKKIIPIRQDYVFSIFEGNFKNSVNNTYLADLTYNSARFEAEIHVDYENNNYNPNGTIENPFTSIYEALEVFQNGEFTKGNILIDTEHTFNNLFIADINKKLGLYFNNSTVNGMLLRNSNYFEINNANIKQHYMDERMALSVVGGVNVVLADCTIDSDRDYAIETTYSSKVNILQTTSILNNKKCCARTSSEIVFRNNSINLAEKEVDSTGKISPNYVLLYDGNLDLNVENDLNYETTRFSTLKVQVLIEGQFFMHEINVDSTVQCLSDTVILNGQLLHYLLRLKINNYNKIICDVKRCINLATNEITTPTNQQLCVRRVWGIT